MTLIRWRPRSESLLLDPFFARFDDLFGDGPTTNTTRARGWYPAMDLVEAKDKLVARLELPGVDPKTVQINLQGDVLTVSGTREDAQVENEDHKVLKREHSYGAFQRTVELPYRVKAESVKATYKNGVMTIDLPKAEEYIGRQIPVEVG